MARQPKFQYAGAVYHFMARGDGGKQSFMQKEDHESFLDWRKKFFASHGWRVHAWVLMGNHFHLLLETPKETLQLTTQSSPTDRVDGERFLKLRACRGRDI